MTTLLEQAKARPVRHRKTAISREEIELALAWLRGEVSLVQVGAALYPTKASTGNTLSRLSSILRVAYAQGVLQIRAGREEKLKSPLSAPLDRLEESSSPVRLCQCGAPLSAHNTYVLGFGTVPLRVTGNNIECWGFKPASRD